MGYRFQMLGMDLVHTSTDVRYWLVFMPPPRNGRRAYRVYPVHVWVFLYPRHTKYAMGV